MILLAANNTGLESLYTLLSLINTEYGEDAITEELLAEHAAGLMIGGTAEYLQWVFRPENIHTQKFRLGMFSYIQITPWDNQELNTRIVEKDQVILSRRITSSGEFRKAGKELSNCLAGYRGNSYIVGIHRQGRYVAALEIRTEESGKRVVVQAYEAHNKEIDKESRLGKAVQNFMEKYGLFSQ